MLYAFLRESKVTAERLFHLEKRIEQTDDCYLPSNQGDIVVSLSYLHSVGLIVFLINDASINRSWIVFDKKELLSKFNGNMFSEEMKVASNTGM